MYSRQTSRHLEFGYCRVDEFFSIGYSVSIASRDQALNARSDARYDSAGENQTRAVSSW